MAEDAPHIEYMRLSEVEAAFAKRNPRRHDVPAIAASIKARGFNAPPLLNEKTTRLVYGHGRTKALRLLCDEDPDATPARIDRAEDGEWTLPVLRGVSFRTRNEAEEYLVADNRIAELSSWEPEGIAAILERIRDRGKLEGTGYVSRDVDRLLYEARKATGAAVREVPAPPLPKKPKTKLGDTWRLGAHRLVCGDATGDAIACVLDGRRADMVWTDPPYGVEYVGKTAAALTIENDSEVGLQALLEDVCGVLIGCTRKGAPWYLSAPAKPTHLMFGAVLQNLGVYRQTLVWVKDVFVLGRSHFHYRHEPIFYGWTPGASCLHPPPTRKEDSVWAFDRPKVSADHPTMKPVALVAHAIEVSSTKGDLVVDPFGGSGTTLLAAEQLGRVSALAELSPAYCDVIVQRWEDLTGKRATRAKSASSHDKSGASRRTVEAGGV